MVDRPKHYLKQFHPKYTPMNKLEEMTKKEEQNTWMALYGSHASWFSQLNDINRPTLWAWILESVSSNRIVCVRNPYFFKIDTEGNQLPYIDRVSSDILQNIEIVNMRAIAGEVDMESRLTRFPNYTLFMENRERGNYRVLKWIPAAGSDFTIAPNLNHKDPVLRKLFQDKRFCQALSLAINRNEINQLCYLGQAVPRQATVISLSPYYEESSARAYTDYNPKRANEILDKIGLKKRDKDGYRLRPDGKTLAVTIELCILSEAWADVAELVKKYWGDIGIKTVIKTESRELWETRVAAGEHDIGVWTTDEAYRMSIGKFIFGQWGGMSCPSWMLWYNSQGKKGEPPTGDYKKLFDLWDKFTTSVDDTQRIRYAKAFLKLRSELCFHIGTVGEVPQLVVVKNNFRNVPEKALNDWSVLTPSNTLPEQYFFKTR